jgi:hypothetical protein
MGSLRSKSAWLACALWVLGAAPSVAWQQAVPAGSDAAFFGAYRHSNPITKWSLKRTLREIPELTGLEPTTDQSPLPEILRRVGENLRTFLANFANTTSLETVEQTAKEPFWSTPGSFVQQFHYLMLVQQEGSAESLIEYRTDPLGREVRPEMPLETSIKTTGFASMPFLFGPREQLLSEFRYLGQQTLQGRRTEVVAFAEHIEPAAVRSRFVMGNTSVPLLLQGVAWIQTGDYQILQMRTDLLAPQPGVALKRVTTVVHFAEIEFQGRPTAFWLPQEVDVTVDQGNYIFVNRHRYSDYQLFKVEILQQVREPEPKAAEHP